MNDFASASAITPAASRPADAARDAPPAADGPAPDFAADLLALQEQPPARLPRTVAYLTMGLFTALLGWAAFGRLDIVATAEGRLVPRSYSPVVQPAEAGIVREVRVRDGDSVRAGDVLLHMDGTTAGADLGALQADAALRALSLRRIDAELRDAPFQPAADAAPELAAQVLAQYRARRQGLQDTQAQEEARLQRAQHELAAARQQLAKLRETVPLVRQSAQSYEKLLKEGFVSELGANEKLRERIEKEQELKAQEAGVHALAAAVEQSRSQLAAIRSSYDTQLLAERTELLAQQQRSSGELRKQAYRSGLLALRAPVDGIVRDIAPYTPGSVVQPGAVLMNLVPLHEPLFAQVAVRNEDVGFVAPGQPVRLKLQAYPFQKYGMLGGTVERVSADSSADEPQSAAAQGRSPQSYKAFVRLDAQQLAAPDGEALRLAPGMVVQAEIHLGRRTVLEYLLSPVQRVAGEAGRER